MPTNTFFNLPEEKKSKIIQAAIDEFSERNISESKVALIMKRTGLSRGSFYTYFESMEDVYLYTITLLRQKRFEYIGPCWDNFNLTFLEFFRELYLVCIKFLLENPHYISISKHLYASKHEISVTLVQGLQDIYGDMFAHRINVDKENGVIKKNIDTEMLTNIFVQYSTVVFVYEVRQGELSLDYYEKYIDNLLSIIAAGILC